jgi:putative FmdB family regulatory protein
MFGVIFGSVAVPIYEYTCKSCDAKFEQLQRSMTNEVKAKCPSCGSTKTARVLSVFAVGAEGSGKSAAASSAPGMCGRCGGPGPCASGY